MRHRIGKSLAVLSFMSVSLIGSSNLLQATPQVGELAGSIRSELAEGGQCGAVLKDYLARIIVGMISDKPDEAAQTREENYAGPEPTKGSSCEELVKRLVQLQPSEQLELARALAEDANALTSSLGANLLFKYGQEDEAVRALSRGIASGQHAQMYFAPSSKSDETVWGRTMVKMSRHLLANLDTYSGRERENVERFLSVWTSTIPFSRAEAERRINELEGQLRRQSPGKTSPRP